MTGTTSAHERALAPDQSAPSVLVVEDDAGIAVLDVHVAALRRKLGVPGLIETVYGRGLRLGEA
jgi:DNA-binding response OmpR family regulator